MRLSPPRLSLITITGVGRSGEARYRPASSNTSSGDHWAQLTVITGGASYAYNPAGNDTISGLGDGAYWDAGTHTVVIRKGQNVLQVIDEVPVNLSASPDLVTAYRQAAQALATKILSHV